MTKQKKPATPTTESHSEVAAPAAATSAATPVASAPKKEKQVKKVEVEDNEDVKKFGFHPFNALAVLVGTSVLFAFSWVIVIGVQGKRLQ